MMQIHKLKQSKLVNIKSPQFFHISMNLVLTERRNKRGWDGVKAQWDDNAETNKGIS